jgi:hypothetical protein
MANKVVLKRSAVTGRNPTTSDLALGELAINTYDGNLFFKKDDGTSSILSVATLTGTQTLTNKTLTSPTISGGTINNAIIGGSTPAAITGTTVTSTGNLISLNSSGDEGGEILLAKPATNSTIAGTGVTIDVWQNRLRIFEQGGTARGVFIDITAASAGVATNLVASGGGTTTNALTIGTGLSGTSFNGSAAVTIAIDSTVATLTGTQTLTNKTLTSPTINSGALSGTFTGAPTFSDTTASTSSTTGAVKIGGGLGVVGNIYVGSASKVGYVNASNVSAVYQYYNAATNSLDTVFG